MHAISTVLMLLLGVTLSGFVQRLLPIRLPLPLIQIAMGATLSYIARFDVPLNPDIFFLLLVPPLLFLDGWRIQKGAFFANLRPIITLAVGLVVFTVAGIGMLIAWLIPAIPLPVAFALAAVLSPTDTVAVSAIMSRVSLPPRLVHMLEGEALLNDAAGLVCFRFAVAAALTGAFSLPDAVLSFALIGGGGVLAGIAVAFTIGLANRWLVRLAGEDVDIQILLSLLIPFAAYLAAERLHCSGILAAAAAGMTMHYVDLAERPLVQTRLQRDFVWNTMQTALNGSIFVLLGDQLPDILQRMPAAEHATASHDVWVVIGYAAVIAAGLIVLRFVWVWTSLKWTLFDSRTALDTPPHSEARTVGLAAFAGVRGAITLAGVLTLPLTMADGTAFPARDLVIVLAMGVILVSLVLATAALPVLSKGLELDGRFATSLAKEEANARSAAAAAALRRIRQICEEPHAETELQSHRDAVARLIHLYREQLSDGRGKNASACEQTGAQAAVRRLRIEALRAERDELHRMRMSREIDDTLHRKLLREVDLNEAALSEELP
jgi:CPA1 family monovalent cation:H+ antiporter